MINSNASNDKDNCRPRYLWHKADFDGLQLILSQINPHTWTAFITVVWNAINEFVPHQNPHGKRDIGTAARRKHYPTHINKLVNKKRHLWKELRTGKTDLNMLRKYQVQGCANKLSHETRLLVMLRETKKANNVGAFYKYINSRIGYRHAVGTLFDADGDLVISDHDKADMVNKYGQ